MKDHNGENTPDDTEIMFTDQQIADLYEDGLISRAEAEVFDIIASQFGDTHQEGTQRYV